MLRKLKYLIKEKGHVYVAYHLEQRDTWAIKQWIKRKAIPSVWKHKVQLLLGKVKEE